MANYLRANERIFLTKKADFLTIYSKDGAVRFMFNILVYGFGIMGLILYQTATTFIQYKLAIFLIFSSFVIMSVFYIVLKVIINNPPKSSSLVVNSPKNKYMMNLGLEVKEHLGDALKSNIPENHTGVSLLRDAEKIKRMGVVLGKAGSGKTVLLRGMLEECLKVGAGAFIIDAKGTIDEIKRFLGLIYMYGREDDLLLVNFTNLNNTNTINFLSYGDALLLKEILIVLASASDEKWKQVDDDFITNLLKLLVYKRDKEGLVLTIKVLRDYLVLNKLVDEAFKYRLVRDKNVEDFNRYVFTKVELSYTDIIEANNDKVKEFHKTALENAKNTDLQGVYEAGLSANNWGGVLTTLGSDYGAIFNVEYPDIDLLKAIQTNKIILVSLPTMKSEDTAKKLGKLLLGIIKSVADKKILLPEPKIPFPFFLDEFGSFGILGFGRFMSKARALGMPMFLFLQSTSQIDVIDDGKGLEKQEIFDNSDCFVCLKNTDDKLAEYLNKTIAKVVYLDKSYKEFRKEIDTKQEASLEADYQKTEEEAIKTEYFAKLNNGEMFFCSGDEAYKSIAKAPSKMNLTYKKFDFECNIPLKQLYPMERLKVELGGETKFIIFPKDNVYNNSEFQEELAEEFMHNLQKSSNIA